MFLEHEKHLVELFDQLFGRHPAHMALLDMDGVIRAVNDSWRCFGQENNLREDYRVEGVNYLDICQTSAENGDRDASAALLGLLEVIETARPKFVMTYACHAPHERRWFKLWVENQSPQSPVLIVAHQLIRHEPVSGATTGAGRQMTGTWS